MKKGTTELTGKNIKLRQYKPEDIKIIHEELGCNPAMMRYTGWNPYFSMESTERFIMGKIAAYEKSGDEVDEYSWVIESDGISSGIIGAYDSDEKERCIEIGYSVFQKNWGKGFASEALELVCDYLMKEEGYKRLKAWSATDNVASKKVLEKAGFVETGVKEDGINVEGEKFDQAFYEKTY